MDGRVWDGGLVRIHHDALHVAAVLCSGGRTASEQRKEHAECSQQSSLRRKNLFSA
jgi:hypothetical protein